MRQLHKTHGLVLMFSLLFFLLSFQQLFAVSTISSNIATEGTLSVTGTSTLSGLVTVGASGIKFSDDTTQTTAATGFTGTLDGNLTVSGNSTLGDAATDTITFNGVVNSGLTFIKEVARTIQIADSTSANTAGPALTLKGAAGSGAAAGGALNITAGAGGTTSGTGGAVSITSGAGAGGNSAGGNISITSGLGSGTSASGNITIQSANETSANSGSVTIISGTTTDAGTTGNVTVQSSNAAETSGDLTLKTGDSSNGRSGAITLGSGIGVGLDSGDILIETGLTAVWGDTGDIRLRVGGGTGGVGSVRDSGDIELSIGPTDSSDFEGGQITLAAGEGNGTGNGGPITITGGGGGETNTAGGGVTISGGVDGGTGTGGTVTIRGGAGDTNGDVTIGATNTNQVNLGASGIDTRALGPLVFGRQTLTMSTAGAADETLTPTTTYVEVTGQDDATDGIDISTTGAAEGQLLIITNISATNVLIKADAANVLVSGGVDRTLTQNDTIVLIFTGNDWLELSFVGDNA